MNVLVEGRARRPHLIVVALVSLLVGVPWVFPGLAPQVDLGPTTFVAFALAAVIGELLVLEPPRGRSTPTIFAVLAAFALLGASPLHVAAIAGLGWAGAAIVRGFMHEPSDGFDLAQRLVAGWALGGLAAIGGYLPGSQWIIGDPSGSHLVSATQILIVSAGMILGPAVWDAAATERPDGGFVHLLRAHLNSTWVANLAQASSAALVAVAYDLLLWGGLLLLFLPIVAVRAGLHRYTDIRRTYDQTVIAMTRMTELTGHVNEGHGVRVGRLATGIARVLGFSEREVGLVERAAHLHEVGRIATDDPEQRAHDREVALAGAAIVREAGDMRPIAEVIERHRDPYRRPGAGDDRSLPLAARIVRTACEYDRLLSSNAANTTWEAIDELHRGMAYDHDPMVVQALANYVERASR